MGLSIIWHQIENFSLNITSSVLSLEPTINSFFQNFWGRLSDWGLIALSTIISAIVAVKLDRKYRDEKRLYGGSLTRDAFKETMSIAGGIFLWGLVIGGSILALISIIRKMDAISHTLGLITIILVIYGYKKRNNIKKFFSRT